MLAQLGAAGAVFVWGLLGGAKEKLLQAVMIQAASSPGSQSMVGTGLWGVTWEGTLFEQREKQGGAQQAYTSMYEHRQDPLCPCPRTCIELGCMSQPLRLHLTEQDAAALRWVTAAALVHS